MTDVTEQVVMGFIELIQERKLRGKDVLAATQSTIAEWLSDRTGLAVTPRHVQEMTKVLSEAGLITVGGGGIGYPNTYDTCEKEMGEEAFWGQVDALLMVWQHPGRKAMAGGA